MTRNAFRRWFWLHKWTSLICTAFLLVICVTGLPLIFRDEIGGWLADGPPYASVPDGAPTVSLDAIAGTARGLYPGQIIGNIFIDDDEPKIMVAMVQNSCRLLGVLLRAAAGAGQLLRITLHEELRQGALAGIVQI